MTKNDQLFAQLILLFQHTGMVGLGKIMNPATNKTEVNMQQASEAIDMLEMLKEKSANNIGDDLKRLLEQSLTDLKLNYVDSKK
jgi:hypothetical protein